MKEEPQDRRDEQLHNAPDAAQEETESFSLEDILDEFGGWSKREPETDEPPAETAQADESPQADAPAEETQPDEALRPSWRRTCRRSRRSGAMRASR